MPPGYMRSAASICFEMTPSVSLQLFGQTEGPRREQDWLNLVAARDFTRANWRNASTTFQSQGLIALSGNWSARETVHVSADYATDALNVLMRIGFPMRTRVFISL